MSGALAKPTVIVGIDIGGTKTHVRVIPDDGGPARDLTLPSDTWRVREWGGDAAGLLRVVAGVVEGAPIAAIAIGAHGCDDDAECKAFQAALSTHTPIPVVVVNDAELMPLALGFAGQIGVVAGTGSIAVCRPSPNRMLVAGGWGWIIGDDGSAASLVREAVRAVSQHFDAGGSRGEPLVEAIFDTLKVPSIPRLSSFLSETRSAAVVGRHATAIFEAAEAGSALAGKVIRDGGRALSRTAALLEIRGAGATHAVAGGSVIAGQPLLWQAFAEGLAEIAGGRIAPHLFTGDPVEGACRLAASTIGTAAGGAASAAASLS
jgi:glucosamine kinase